jgi:uncharacterized membrane protein
MEILMGEPFRGSRNIRIQMERVRGSGRLALLDELRGLAIANMAAYHLCYDLTYIYGLGWQWFSGRWAGLWQLYICVSFLLIAGICTGHSERPYLRALKVAACAAAISAATFLAYPEQAISFGILHCMAASMLLFALLRGPFSRIPALPGFAAAALLALVSWNVAKGYIGFEGLWVYRLPGFLYGTDWLFPLGFRSPSYRSADYFPLLPYFFVFMAGVFCRFAQTRPTFAERPHARLLAFAGRHSLPIYMLHQPAIMGVLYLLYLAPGRE